MEISQAKMQEIIDIVQGYLDEAFSDALDTLRDNHDLYTEVCDQFETDDHNEMHNDFMDLYIDIENAAIVQLAKALIERHEVKE